ncbi:hypothetical protein MKW98_017013 [Papaver atlanticum]|uniref:Uncharacterized protein n=1 Tax=Papaver atlanticum TaxID=357466 RepID=A0AAD4THL2_9MAGN|nr:hypothetical protein MKW98_017013 [Papaver atlanticum]
MDNLSVGIVPPSEPDSRPPPITPQGPYDLQATFVCSIRLSAKKLFKLLKKKLPPKVDKHITVIVPTNKPVSFGVSSGDLGFSLRMMIPGREIHRIGLFDTVPCTKKGKASINCTKEGNKASINCTR